jgi:MCM6-like protein
MLSLPLSPPPPPLFAEAARLLKKSILHVREDDVRIELGEAVEAAGDVADGVVVPDEMELEETREEAITLPFQKYQNIAHSVVLRIRKDEESEAGMSEAEIIEWCVTSRGSTSGNSLPAIVPWPPVPSMLLKSPVCLVSLRAPLPHSHPPSMPAVSTSLFLCAGTSTPSSLERAPCLRWRCRKRRR